MKRGSKGTFFLLPFGNGARAIVLPLTQFDAAILTANNGRIIATVCHKVENSGANQSLAR
jgi:hypothetical protein